MKLNYEQIKSITVGAVKITRNESGIDFFRLTEKQVEAFVREQENHILKVYADSCVRFDFHTNSKALSFSFSDVRKASGREFYSFDVYENGDMIYSYFNRHTKVTSDKFTVELSGDSHVQIFLPNLAAVTVSDVEIDDGAVITPAKTDISLLMHGDSITQGYDAYHSSMSYANIVARKLNANVVNAGIGGAVFNPDVIDRPEGFVPDVVTVAYGINDWVKLSKQAFQSNFNAFVDKIGQIYPEAKIYFILPIWYGHSDQRVTDCGSFSEHCEYMRQVIEAHGFTVIDGLALVPHDPAMFSADLTHPNDIGFVQYATNLVKYIK